MLIYQAPIALILFVFLLITIWNMILLRKRKELQTDNFPFVSILIPARNEEVNIKQCVESLLKQNYPDYEVIVLNDNSTDRTREILMELKRAHPHLKIINGKPLAEGWTGKTYACKQLADEAKGNWLLFTDADTMHTPRALRGAMNTAINRSADLLSLFPKTVMKSFGERLVMPMLFFTAFVMLPHYFVDKKGYNKFALAAGPFMLFRKSAYEQIGGHGSVKDALVEDVWLSRKIKEHGLRLVVIDGKHLSSVRMYRSFKEIWNGFSKNIFAGFNFSAPVLFIVQILYLTLFVMPFVFLIVSIAENNYGLIFGLVLIQVIILYLIRILLAIKFRLGVISTVLHPLGALAVPVIAFNSWRLIALGSGAKWKGRIYHNKPAVNR